MYFLGCFSGAMMMGSIKTVGQSPIRLNGMSRIRGTQLPPWSLAVTNKQRPREVGIFVDQSRKWHKMSNGAYATPTTDVIPPSYQEPPVIKSPQLSNIKCPQISGAIADSPFFFRNCPVLFRSVLQSLIWIAQRNSETGSQAGQQTCALIWWHGCDGSW